jgi:hypothetical protein
MPAAGVRDLTKLYEKIYLYMPRAIFSWAGG